ncbi:hypothetical protein [Sphingomonas lacusdianchii]|uniref:hypothetical protein n=1 Tax=Sphingomonas lacusdianchii TaxID=2917992 RepID=UPI001F57BB4E|nr:hypothetical protein [Sphingomonas sp. JXJ CY 53]
MGERLAKLIPGEALALYGAGSAIVPDNQNWGLWFLSAACLGFTIALRWKITAENGKPAQFRSVMIAAVSFILWVIALDFPAGPINWPDNLTWLPALLALLWATIVPVFYKGDQKV